MKSAPIITAVAALLAVGMTLATVLIPEGSSRVHEADRAFRAGDARTLAKLVNVREWPVGDREAMVKEVLAAGGATSLAGCRPVGPSSVRQAFNGEWHAVSWWRAPNGQAFPIRLRMCDTPMGPRLVGFIREVVVHSSRQRARMEGGTGMARHAQRLRLAGERLSAWNLPGTVDTVTSDDGETIMIFTPWSRYVATAERSVTQVTVAPARVGTEESASRGFPSVPMLAEPPQEKAQWPAAALQDRSSVAR